MSEIPTHCLCPPSSPYVCPWLVLEMSFEEYMCPRPGHLSRPSDPLDLLRNGIIVVEYLVLVELPSSVQLEREYEKVKTALKEELQNASQNSCLNNQSE